jgi:hypothetical protein
MKHIPYWIDLALSCILAFLGGMLLSGDQGFVSLSLLGFLLLLLGLALGVLDIWVLRAGRSALQVRTGVALVLVLAPLVFWVLPKPRGFDPTGAALMLAAPNFIWFWIGLLRLTRQPLPFR